MPVDLVGKLKCPDMPARLQQNCPLCGTNHPIMTHGLVNDINSGELRIAYDKGYSFCNCRDIFYTDWKNIDQTVYDDEYFEKYKDGLTKDITVFEIKKYWEIFKRFKKDINSFFEIGCITDHVLDYVSEQGVKPDGIDICDHTSKYEISYGDFETHVFTGIYDIIYASHVFEHFWYPGLQLQRCYNQLSDGGLLYIAMPDTFFIDWNHSIGWDWVVSEHHILWSMDSFIEYAEEYGFKCVHKERGTDLFNREDGTTFWKQDFKVVLCKQQ